MQESNKTQISNNNQINPNSNDPKIANILSKMNEK